MAVHYAVKAAARVVTSEKGRNFLLSVILIPVLLIVLICGMVLYLVSTPLSALEELFPEMDQQEIGALVEEYGYLQDVDTSSLDYIVSNSSDLAGLVFGEGGIPFVYYNQADSRWSDIPYGKTGTIGKSACGPTSMAMVISTLNGSTYDPVFMSAWAYDNGYRCEGSGSYHSLIPGAAKAFGLTVEGCTQREPERIVNALAEGKLVVAIMAKGHFTKNGHYIVLRGLTPDGKIQVADPASVARSKEVWDFSLILDEARPRADAGGPFWIIG